MNTRKVGTWMTVGVALVLAGYLALNVLYSLLLKRIVILDVMAIALGFVLRVLAGGFATRTPLSGFMVACTALLALFLGFGKRRAELALLAHGAGSHRKVLDGYTLPLLDQFITIVSGTTIIAYSLYTFSAPNLPDNHVMVVYRRADQRGLWAHLARIEGDAWRPLAGHLPYVLSVTAPVPA